MSQILPDVCQFFDEITRWIILLTTGETLVHHDACVIEGKLIIFIDVFNGEKRPNSVETYSIFRQDTHRPIVGDC